MATQQNAPGQVRVMHSILKEIDPTVTKGYNQPRNILDY